jgi:hypothetical protein
VSVSELEEDEDNNEEWWILDFYFMAKI